MLTYATRPLSDTTWLMPGKREESKFRASWSDTLVLLEREIKALRGKNVVIGVDVRERDIRLDGMLRADAKPTSPAVEVAFDSKHGPLLYRCDRFLRPRWGVTRYPMESHQANIRAVAMTLEALRAVDRYGASASGEQYRGYRALPAGRGDAATGMTTTEAAEIVIRAAYAKCTGVGEPTREWFTTDPRGGAVALRRARSFTHPDRNDGDTSRWNLVDNAVQTLRQAGWLPKAAS